MPYIRAAELDAMDRELHKLREDNQGLRSRLYRLWRTRNVPCRCGLLISATNDISFATHVQLADPRVDQVLVDSQVAFIFTRRP